MDAEGPSLPVDLTCAGEWRSRLAAIYAAVTRALAETEAIEGFAVAPLFRAADGRLIDAFEIGLSEADALSLLVAGARAELEEYRRGLYGQLTTTFKIAPAELAALAAAGGEGGGEGAG